jgi:putative component of membrane protein insertase Oxa1/YidC/SpoIIIJ protein YidD
MTATPIIHSCDGSTPSGGVPWAMVLEALFLVYAMGILIHMGKGPYVQTPAFVRFYQGPLDHLSAVKQGECPMSPSCSEYSIQSLQKHGFLMGWIMSCDRLMRCGNDELRVSPEIMSNGKLKCYDPVSHFTLR